MARQVVGNPFEGQIGTTGPTAEVVDIYERGVVKNSPFSALAETLSAIEKKATPALARLEQRAAERELAQGQELYAKTRLSMGDAVRDGIITEGESPYVRKGYRVGNLKALAVDYTVGLQKAYEQDQLHKRSDPDAIGSYLKNFDKKFREDNGFDAFNDSEVAQFFTAQQQQTDETFMKAWVRDNNAYMTDQSYKAVDNSTAKIILGLDIGAAGEAPEVTAKKLETARLAIIGIANEANIDGLDRSRVSQSIADAVIGMAENTNNPAYLNILDGLKLGSGNFSDILKYKTKIADSSYRIQQRLYQQDEREYQLEKRNDEEEAAGLYSQGMDVLRGENWSLQSANKAEDVAAQLRKIGTVDSIRLSENLLDISKAAKKVAINPIERSATEIAQAASERSVFFDATKDEKKVRDYLVQQVSEGKLPVTSFDNELAQWKAQNKDGSRPWETDKIVADYYNSAGRFGVKKEETDAYGLPIGERAVQAAIESKALFRQVYRELEAANPTLLPEQIADQAFKAVVAARSVVVPEVIVEDPSARDLNGADTSSTGKWFWEDWFSSDPTDPEAPVSTNTGRAVPQRNPRNGGRE